MSTTYSKDEVLSAASEMAAAGNTRVLNMLIGYAKLLDAASKGAKQAASDASDDAYMREKPWFGQRVGWVHSTPGDLIVVWPSRATMEGRKVRVIDYRVFTPEKAVARVLQGFVDELPGNGVQSDVRPILDKAGNAGMVAAVDDRGKVHVDRCKKCQKKRL